MAVMSLLLSLTVKACSIGENKSYATLRCSAESLPDESSSA